LRHSVDRAIATRGDDDPVLLPRLLHRTPRQHRQLPWVMGTPEVIPAAPADTPPPKRVVSREGTVIVSRSIQAPTAFALENRESRRTVNYLHSESDDINLKKFAGKKVVVSGEELIDQRWINTPIIEVESIQVVR
jgi:hypothetical protein